MKLNFQNILEIMSSLIQYINLVTANFRFQVDFKQSKKCFYFHLKLHFLLNEKLPEQIMLKTRYQNCYKQLAKWITSYENAEYL